MFNNEDFLQLSEYRSNVCEVLKTAIQGKNVDDLSESVRKTLEVLERSVGQFRSYLLLCQAIPGSYMRSSEPSKGGRIVDFEFRGIPR